MNTEQKAEEQMLFPVQPKARSLSVNSSHFPESRYNTKNWKKMRRDVHDKFENFYKRSQMCQLSWKKISADFNFDGQFYQQTEE